MNTKRLKFFFVQWAAGLNMIKEFRFCREGLFNAVDIQNGIFYFNFVTRYCHTSLNKIFLLIYGPCNDQVTIILPNLVAADLPYLLVISFFRSEIFLII